MEDGVAVWLELICDLRHPGCQSETDDNPTMMSKNDAVDVSSAMRSLEKLAKEAGWVRMRGERETEATWGCPKCLTVTNHNA